jgi:hypothetical protein
VQKSHTTGQESDGTKVEVVESEVHPSTFDRKSIGNGNSNTSITSTSSHIAEDNKKQRQGWCEKLTGYKFSQLTNFSYPSFLKSTTTLKEEALNTILSTSDDNEKNRATAKLTNLVKLRGENTSATETRANELIRIAYGKRALSLISSDSGKATADLEKAIPNYIFTDKKKDVNEQKKELATDIINVLVDQNNVNSSVKKNLTKAILEGNYYEDMLKNPAETVNLLDKENLAKAALITENTSINAFIKELNKSAGTTLPESFYQKTKDYLKKNGCTEETKKSVNAAAMKEAFKDWHFGGEKE